MAQLCVVLGSTHPQQRWIISVLLLLKLKTNKPTSKYNDILEETHQNGQCVNILALTEKLLCANNFNKIMVHIQYIPI